MSATHTIGPLDDRLFYPRFPRQAVILFWYMPSILVTLVGATALSMCWLTVVHTPGMIVPVVLLALIQVAWFASLVDVWLQNTYWVFRRELAARNISDARPA